MPFPLASGASSITQRIPPVTLSPVTTAVSPGRGAEDVSWLGKILTTLAAIAILAWSFRLSGYFTFAPWLACR